MQPHLQCAEQHASHSNVTKCCACHEKWFSWLISVTYETSFTMRGATGITLQPHQILRLPRKIAFQNQRQICRKQLKRQFQCGDDSTMIRAWPEHDPSMIRAWTRHLAPARSPRLLFALRRRILYWKLQHFALRLSTQISPNTAPATKSDTPRSPNTAPATQNDSHDWCPPHMKRHFQCAEQQASPSNLTKYCACHAKWLSWLIFVTYGTSLTMRRATSITLRPHQILRLPRKIAFQNLREIVRKRLKCHLQCAAGSNMIRTRSEPDPNTIRAWTRHLAPARSPRLLFALRRHVLYWKLQHFALRLSSAQHENPLSQPPSQEEPSSESTIIGLVSSGFSTIPTSLPSRPGISIVPASFPSRPSVPVCHYRAGFHNGVSNIPASIPSRAIIPVYYYRAGFHSGASTIPVSCPSVPTIPVYHYRAGFHSGASTIPASLPSAQHEDHWFPYSGIGTANRLFLNPVFFEDPVSQPPSQVANMKIHYPSLPPKCPTWRLS